MVLQLGAFDLVEPISTGGMGTVWRATHRASERIVAVKTVTAKNTGLVYNDSFEREVQAVAKLNHPNVIGVYDFGRVPKRVAEKSELQLEPNSPWFAMEYAESGSLARLPVLAHWDTLKAVLYDILDGLAHAHARSVVHRDIKPGNVLLTQTENGLVCKLTDFGIAHLNRSSQSTHEVFASAAGTPWYMAPEQIDSRWRDYGPWTDLYAVGCLTYRLATGHTPFDSSSPVDVARQHLYEQPPRFEPNFECPAGFDEWVAKLLSKNYVYRFRRAAEATWALRQLDPTPIMRLQQASRSAGESDEASTIDVSEDTLVQSKTDSRELATLTQLPPSIGSLASLSALMPTQFSMPPIPELWEYNYEPSLLALSGAGLNLFGLREPPYVAREFERDIVWSAFRATAIERRARAILVTGDAGIGKTRFANWIARRAHEVGSATTLIARHQPRADRNDDLAAMFRRLFECDGLDVDRGFQRIHSLLPFYSSRTPDEMLFEAVTITRLMFPDDTPSSKKVPTVGASSPSDRYGWAHELLHTMSLRRPVIVILDDVQWAYGACEFAEHILERQEQIASSILFVMTARDKIPLSRVLEVQALDRLRSRNDVTEIHLDPFSEEEHRILLERSLMLSPKTADRMVAETPANPLYATQIFGDWAERGALHSTSSGFELTEDVSFPTDLNDAWIQRTRSILSQLTEPDLAMTSLEIAACFGGVISNREWYPIARDLGIRVDDELVWRLQLRGLIDSNDDGWWFRHEPLREALEEQSRLSGAVEKYHGAIADFLRNATDVTSLLRRTNHDAIAGRTLQAIESLVGAVQYMIYREQIRRPIAELDRAEAMLETNDLRDDPIRFRIERLRCDAFFRSGDVNRLSTSATVLRQRSAEDHDRVFGGWYYGLAQSLSGEDEAARGVWNDALQLAVESKSWEGEAKIRRSLAWLDIRLGNPDPGEVHLNRALELFSDHEVVADEALVLMMLGEVASQREKPEEAFYLIQQSQSMLRSVGDLSGLAHATIMLAEISRRSGRFDDAERHYNDALLSARRIGHSNQFICLMNLGYLSLERSDVIRAKKHFEDARIGLERGNQDFYLLHCDVGMLAVSAMAQDLPEFERLFEIVESGARRESADADGGRCLELAGDAWREFPEHSERCYGLALFLTPEHNAEQRDRIRDKMNRLYS